MLIHELANTIGISVDTIRFYEKRGLLDHEHFTRKENQYREYGEAAVSRLNLIKQGKAAGLTLSEICRFINAWESDQLTTQEKVAFFEHKIEEIDARIAQLEGVKAYLRQKLYRMGEAVTQSEGV